MPVLFLIIFGVIEFGWAFFENTDVRHGARETSRLIAVNYDPDPIPSGCTGEATDGAKQSCAIILEACARMDDSGSTTVTVTSSSKGLGQPATVTVSKPLDTLTGFLDSVLGGKTLRSSVETRLELAGTWSNMTKGCP